MIKIYFIIGVRINGFVIQGNQNTVNMWYNLELEKENFKLIGWKITFKYYKSDFNALWKISRTLKNWKTICYDYYVLESTVTLTEW